VGQNTNLVAFPNLRPKTHYFFVVSTMMPAAISFADMENHHEKANRTTFLSSQPVNAEGASPPRPK